MREEIKRRNEEVGRRGKIWDHKIYKEGKRSNNRRKEKNMEEQEAEERKREIKGR